MKRWRIPEEERSMTKEQKYLRGIHEEIFDFVQKIRKYDLDEEAKIFIRSYFDSLCKYWEMEDKYRK